MVRNAIKRIGEEYRERPELVFNNFMEEARRTVELPALWTCIYLEEGQEKLEMTEPTYSARVSELKDRVRKLVEA